MYSRIGSFDTLKIIEAYKNQLNRLFSKKKKGLFYFSRKYVFFKEKNMFLPTLVTTQSAKLILP